MTCGSGIVQLQSSPVKGIVSGLGLSCSQGPQCSAAQEIQFFHIPSVDPVIHANLSLLL